MKPRTLLGDLFVTGGIDDSTLTAFGYFESRFLPVNLNVEAVSKFFEALNAGAKDLPFKLQWQVAQVVRDPHNGEFEIRLRADSHSLDRGQSFHVLQRVPMAQLFLAQDPAALLFHIASGMIRELVNGFATAVSVGTPKHEAPPPIEKVEITVAETTEAQKERAREAVAAVRPALERAKKAVRE